MVVRDLWLFLRQPTFRIDKGSLGAVALLGIYIHHYASYVGILCIF